ncbi:hypothetical protein V1520DRAFT_349407 [Lipomyces starkeyi]|uniref:Uncharacterized protein n=1 Tax=Lipomyces starkeyi NRRL Y-11557 TaxID=675824 RepID=A0A1E3PWE0_LIPST|nr:hypothetical protein LIPSTDRAFT_201501 [Lipomyces starkeyi NRRL Y-11557]
MAVNLGTLGLTAAAVALVTAMYFLHIGHPHCYRRNLKSSEIFVKSLYTTESLLSDALRTKYKVLIDGDGLLCVYSYENSPYIQSVVIGTRTRRQKRLEIFGSATLMVLYTLFGLLVMISYGAGDSSFIIAAVGMTFTISCIFLGFYPLKSSFKKETGVATVYFNATEENWVTLSDLALFNSSDRIEVAIKWPGELFSQIVNLWLHTWVSALSIILNEGGGRRKKDKPEMVTIIFSAIACCAQIASQMLFVRRMRRTVPVVEVQFAQAVNEKDADTAADADLLRFDVEKIARKFANDVAKEFGSSGNKWMAGSGVYYDFAIAGEHSGLVYGRMRAGGILANT